MIQMNFQPRNKVTDLENKLLTTKGEKRGWSYKKGGLNQYTYPYIEKIGNQSRPTV